MSYKLFISHTDSDRKIAEEVGRILNNAFEGAIVPYFAFREIKSGDKWKDEIRKSLEECDAIVSIITKNSANKPWIFIEWSAYWVANKKYYILTSDEIKLSDLIQPMQDTQVTIVTDIDSVKGLFSRLSEDVGKRYIPFDKAEDFVFSIQSALIEQRRTITEKSYLKYKDNLDLLPQKDSELKKIAIFFYERGNIDIFKKVVQQIKLDSTRRSLAFKFIKEGDYDNTFYIAEQIRSASIQAAVVIEFIERELEDLGYVKHLLEDISAKNASYLRQVCIYLAQNAKEDTALFKNTIALFANMSELRKVAIYLVENNRFDNEMFVEIVERLTENNRVELRKVGSALVQQGKQDSTEFKTILIALADNNQKEAGKLLLELKNHDVKRFEEFMNLNLITQQEMLEKLTRRDR